MTEQAKAGLEEAHANPWYFRRVRVKVHEDARRPAGSSELQAPGCVGPVLSPAACTAAGVQSWAGPEVNTRKGSLPLQLPTALGSHFHTSPSAGLWLATAQWMGDVGGGSRGGAIAKLAFFSGNEERG